jgi:hypothetical protein
LGCSLLPSLTTMMALPAAAVLVLPPFPAALDLRDEGREKGTSCICPCPCPSLRVSRPAEGGRERTKTGTRAAGWPLIESVGAAPSIRSCTAFDWDSQ